LRCHKKLKISLNEKKELIKTSDIAVLKVTKQILFSVFIMIYQYGKCWIPMKNMEKRLKTFKIYRNRLKRYINDVSENEIYAK